MTVAARETVPTPTSPTPATGRRRVIRHVIMGVTFWLTLSVFGFVGLAERQSQGDVARRLAVHAFTFQLPAYRVEFPHLAVFGVGDAVKIETADGQIPAGEVLEVWATPTGSTATIGIYPEFVPRLTTTTRLVAVSATGDISWVLKVLFPQEKLERIRGILMTGFATQKDRLWRELQPGVERLLDEAGWILKEDMQDLLVRRRDDFEAIARVVRERAWDTHLRQSFRDDVWPLVEERSWPLLQTIGNEIVAEVPVWAMSWSYLVENLPFSNENALQRRMRKFIAEKAIPIIEKHAPEFREMAVDIVRETALNKKVMTAVENGLYDVVRDQRFKDATRSIVSAWMSGNPRMQTLLAEAWRRPDIQAPLRRFFDAQEPDLRIIGNMLLLDDDEKGINPDLARILRRKLIGRDQNWLALEIDPAGLPLVDARLLGAAGGSR